jgi:hypothetical protein
MNPEFQRYLWLELTPHRLIAAPILLVAVFVLVSLIDPGDSWRPLAEVSFWMVVAVGILWGARNASEAITGEVREGTWDQQRLSSLGPWAMTWGKLLGAPVFTWYTSAPALVLMLIGSTERSGFVAAIGHVVFLIAVILLAHAVGMLVSLQLTARSSTAAARSMIGLHLLGMAAGLLWVRPLYSAFSDDRQGGPIAWFNLVYSEQAFIYFTIAAMVVWSVIGCYRLMRTELQLRNAPWVWIAFVLYCMVYVAGFGSAYEGVSLGDAKSLTSAPLLAYGVAMVLALLMLFIEPKDPVEFSRLLASFRARRWAVFLQTIPRWLCVLPIAAALIVALLMTDSVGATFCASAMAFFLRDAGIVVLLNLVPNRGRADAAAIVYLLVLYGLLPALVSAASNIELGGWFYPSLTKGVVAGVLPALIQAAVVWVLVRNRWHGLWAAIDDQP